MPVIVGYRLSRDGLRAFVLLASLGIAPSSVGAQGAAPENVVRRFNTGSSSVDIGYAVSADGDDREEDGPAALTSDEKGRLYVLDQINGKIVSFAPAKDSTAQTYDLPRDVHATDLLVRGETMFAFDGAVHALQPTGQETAPTRGLTETRSVEDSDKFTTTAFAQFGSVSDAELEAGSDGDVSTRGIGKRAKAGEIERQFVDTSGRGPVVVEVATADGGAGAQLTVTAKEDKSSGVKIHLRVPDKLGTVAFLGIDKNGRMFVLAENVPRNIADAAFAFVARYSPTGTLEGSYELPLAETASISRRSVTVSPDGNVFFLKATKKTVDIIGIGFRPMTNAAVITSAKGRANVAAASWADTSWVGMAVGPLSRQRIVQTAIGFEGLKWNLGPSNYGPANDQVCAGFGGRIRRPMYLIGREGQQVQSVPYCWGCQGSLAQFAQKVQRGSLAGNVCTKNNPRTDVVGVDCSSFVSATWGLSTHFTTAAIPAITNRVGNPWDLQPGDALDKPGSHVVLFLGFTPQRQALVMEASPGACKGRVCRNVYPLSSLLARGFIPVRYRALAEGRTGPSKM